jgi:uncharacterized protein (TIGR00725 family)
MEVRKKKRIGVIGGSKADAKSRQMAFQVGKMIAEKDAVLVCGGLIGIMEAASRGAKQAGGLTIGILPGNNPDDANPYIDIPLATGMGYTRNSLVAMNSDALIAISGRYGTLTEIAFGCIYRKKIIGLGTWDIEGVIQVKAPEEAVKLALSS